MKGKGRDDGIDKWDGVPSRVDNRSRKGGHRRRRNDCKVKGRINENEKGGWTIVKGRDYGKGNSRGRPVWKEGFGIYSVRGICCHSFCISRDYTDPSKLLGKQTSSVYE